MRILDIMQHQQRFLQSFINLPEKSKTLVEQEKTMWELFQLKKKNISEFKKRLIKSRQMKNVLHQIVNLLESIPKSSDKGPEIPDVYNSLNAKTRDRLLLDLEAVFEECSTTLLEGMDRKIVNEEPKDVEQRKSTVRTRLFSKINALSISFINTSNKISPINDTTETKKHKILKKAKRNLVYLLDSDISRITQVLQQSKQIRVEMKVEITRLIKLILKKCFDEGMSLMGESVIGYVVKLRWLKIQVTKNILRKFSDFEIRYIKKVSKALLIRDSFQDMSSKLFKSLSNKYASSKRQKSDSSLVKEKRRISNCDFKIMYQSMKRKFLKHKPKLQKKPKPEKNLKFPLKSICLSLDKFKKNVSILSQRLGNELCPRRIFKICKNTVNTSEKKTKNDSTALKGDFITRAAHEILSEYYGHCYSFKPVEKKQILENIRLLLGYEDSEKFIRKFKLDV